MTLGRVHGKFFDKAERVFYAIYSFFLYNTTLNLFDPLSNTLHDVFTILSFIKDAR